VPFATPRRATNGMHHGARQNLAITSPIVGRRRLPVERPTIRLSDSPVVPRAPLIAGVRGRHDQSSRACHDPRSRPLGAIAHAVAGFDHRRAEQELGVPYGFHAECLIAVGRPGSGEHLPERLQTREAASQRRALHEIAFEGEWEKPLEIQA
jgi:hypothetical protein